MDNETSTSETLSWTFFPARDSLRKTILALAIIIFFLVIILIFYGIYWVFFGILFLLATLNSYFFPTHYRLENDQIVIKKLSFTTVRHWNEFRKNYVGKNGVLLSPFSKPTFLNNFRGIFLYFPADLEIREKIIKFVEEKIPQ